MPDELEWRPLERWPSSPRARSHPSRRRSTCCASAAVACRRALRMGLAVAAAAAPATSDVSRSRTITAREWIARSDGPAGLDDVWGPLLRGKFGAPRRRHLDGVAVEQAHPAPPDSRARRRARSCSATRAAAGSRCSRRLRELIERAGRARPDRPAGGAALTPRRARVRGHAGRAELLPRAATTRARFEPAGEPERYDAVHRHRPQRRLRGAARPGARRGGRRRLPRAAGGDRVPRGALPAAGARPPVHALLLDQRRRPPTCRSSA